MKSTKFLTILAFTIGIGILSSSNASAQFNVRPNTTNRVDAGVDTIKLQEVAKPSPLDLSVYSQAYDKYIKREIFKFRNKINLDASFAVNQTSMDNWAAGGNNSFTGELWFKLTHTYTKEEAKFDIVSQLEGAYAMLITNEAARKSKDFLNFNSTPNWTLGPKWKITGSMVLRTQFTNSYIAPGDTILASSFFAPATLNLSGGITYAPPAKKFTAYLAPISGNGTFVLNEELSQAGAFGVKPGERSITRFGAFARLEYNTKFFKDKATFWTKAESFWDYYNCPNLILEARVTFQFSKIFGVELYAKAIYDDMIHTPRIDENNYWQFMQTSGFKLTYNFSSKANTTTLDELLRR